MRRKIAGVAVAAGLGALAALALTASSAPGAPNQGDPDKVLKVDNPNVSCANPVPGTKVEGDFGRKIYVEADSPIDFVTVKSGKGATVVSAEFGDFWAKIKLSKAVSNYVVWTCPNPPTTTTTTTPTTTTTTPTTTTTTPTTTTP